jgi:hypothetical protein
MKTVIEMAREADVYCTTRQPTLDAMLERFAALVRADENKACQDVCDDVYRAWTLRDDEDETDPPDPIDCKLAIRARGDT